MVFIQYFDKQMVYWMINRCNFEYQAQIHPVSTIPYIHHGSAMIWFHQIPQKPSI